MTNLVVRNEIRGGAVLVRLERVHVLCPACGQRVEAIATDGRVKGYCAIANKCVDFMIETRRTDETKAEISAELAPIREGRDSKGRFVKGNVPRNKWGISGEG